MMIVLSVAFWVLPWGRAPGKIAVEAFVMCQEWRLWTYAEKTCVLGFELVSEQLPVIGFCSFNILNIKKNSFTLSNYNVNLNCFLPVLSWCLCSIEPDFSHCSGSQNFKVHTLYISCASLLCLVKWPGFTAPLCELKKSWCTIWGATMGFLTLFHVWLKGGKSNGP